MATLYVLSAGDISTKQARHKFGAVSHFAVLSARARPRPVPFSVLPRVAFCVARSVWSSLLNPPLNISARADFVDIIHVMEWSRGSPTPSRWPIAGDTIRALNLSPPLLCSRANGCHTYIISMLYISVYCVSLRKPLAYEAWQPRGWPCRVKARGCSGCFSSIKYYACICRSLMAWTTVLSPLC